MTWAQTTFLYCFLVMVPVAGILFAKRRKQQGKSRFVGFAIGCGTMGLAMLGCCFLAHGFFPKYPSVPVSEWLANAFTLPAVAVTLLLLWRPRPSPEHKRSVVRWTTVFVGFYVLGVAASYWINLWPYRAALPWNATQIREREYGDLFFGDFDYRMSARISEEQFREYVRSFKLNRMAGHEGMLNREPGEHLHTTLVYGLEGERSGMIAGYENGYIHVRAWQE